MNDCVVVWSKSAQATIVPSLNREPLDWAQNEVAVEPEPVVEVPSILPLTHVKVGLRVKHFRQRRDGSYLHGTVREIDQNKSWCTVQWDKGRPGLVMIECLLPSDRALVAK